MSPPPRAFARTACSASSLRRYVADSTTAAAAAQPKTKPLIHSVSRRFSRLLFACAPLLLGAAALVSATPAQAQVVNICDRTAQVETAILARLSHSDCSAVTSTELAGIAGMLTLDRQGITSLKASDFSGLSNLKKLDLSNNALTMTGLPAGMFSDLSSLTHLYLHKNEDALTGLPAGLFSGLSSLTLLDLSFNAFTSLPENVFSGLSTLETLHLDSNALSSLPENVFSGLSNLKILSLDDNAFTMTGLPAKLFSGLSKLETLYLFRNALTITDLPAGLFSGLSALTELDLSENAFVSLREGLFSGLSSLEILKLNSNMNLESLPANVFSGLSTLTELHLHNNKLSALPDGLFSGLSNLRALSLFGNGGALKLALSLEVDSVTRAIRVLAPLGAPEDLVIPLRISGGTVSGSTTATVTIPAGATTSPAVTVDFANVMGTANVRFGALPALTAYEVHPQVLGIAGLTLVAGDAVSFFPGICGRTVQVQAAIRAKLSDKACHLVTVTDLTGIDGTLDVSNPTPKLTALEASDFAGLSSLEVLDLGDNSLTAAGLPANVFSALTSLTELHLNDNALTSLSAGVFSGLSSLTELHLNNNQLASLPANVFSSLSSLTKLHLNNNSLTASGLPVNPVNVFSSLTSLTELHLNNNSLASLPATLLSGLTSLTELHLNHNALTSLPAGVFSALTSLTELHLNNNQLSTLPDGLFSGLTNLIVGDLDFRNNKTALVLPLVLDYQRISQSQGSLSVGLAIGAPVALSIPLQVAAGDATLSASTVTLAAGGVSSSSVTVTRGAGNANITLNFGTLPVLTNTGLTLGQGVNVILSVPIFSTASPPDLTQLQNTALTPVQFGEASGLDTPLTHVLSVTTSTSGVTLTNGLPTGLSFDTATRRLTGTPTTLGVYTLTYTATDSDGDTATQTLKLTVVADTVPSFGASTVARQDYKQFAATGGLTLPVATSDNLPLTYSLSATTSDGTVDSADTLPQGLDFAASTRILSGTPTAAGTYAMTYTASDADDDSVNLPFQLVVDSVPTLVNAMIGSPTYVKDYAINAVALPQAEGGTDTVSYSLTASTTDGTLASNLPAGLVFAASTRTLSGTPTAAGTYTMTYTATDTDSDSDARTFELTVAAFYLTCDRTAQIRDALVARLKSDGTLGASDGCAQVTDNMLSRLDGTLSVSNPTPKLTALVASDFAGLSILEVLNLGDNSLTVRGLPANVFSSLTGLTGLNLSNNALSAILNATLNPDLLAGLVALEGLSLEGNSLTASHFPSDLFDDNTGLLTLNLSGSSLSGGLPSALPATLTGLELQNSSLPGLPAGFFTKFSSLTALDLTGNTVALTLQLHYLGNSKIQARLPEGAPWPLTVSVSGASGSGTQISPNSISLTQGQTASAELRVSGYPATISLGNLPSVPATHSPTGLTLVKGGSLTLTVPTFSTSVADSRHTVGASLSVQLPAATSGTDSITYGLSVSTDDGTLSNNLPAGLSFSTTTRILSGVPTATGTYAVTWTATDADGDSAELTFNLVVEVDSTPAFAQSASIADQTWPQNTNITAVPSGGGSAPCTLGGDPLSPCQLPAATGGNGTLQYSLTATTSDGTVDSADTLPAGLDFAAGTRQLSGTPTAVGTYSLTYSVSDKEGDAVSLSFKILVDGTPVFSSTQGALALKAGTPLTPVTLPVATGGNLPLTYSLSATTSDGTVDSADSLPEGLDFAASTRILSGTPTAAGTYAMTYAVTDADNDSVSQPFQLVVDSVPTLAKAMIGNQTYAKGYAIDAVVLPQAEGGTGTVSYGLTASTTDGTLASNLPAGLVFAASTRTLSGTPTAVGTYAMTYTATDVDSDSDALTFELKVAAFFLTCDRTAQVRDALVARLKIDGTLGSSDGCAQVTDNMLSALDGTLDVSDPSPKLTALAASDFAGLSILEVLDLGDNSLTASGLPASPVNVFSPLTSLTELHLNKNQLASLPATLLSPLTSLTGLHLNDNSLASLPATLLSALTKLTELHLNHNALTSLSAGVFSGLSSLTKLKLNNNQLSALPNGLFSGLTKLKVGDLDFRNNKAALVLPVVLDYQRSSQSQGSLSVGLAIGAPVALTIPLRVAAGTATLSASTVTLAAGGTSSGSVTVTRGAGNANITLSFGTLPVLTDTGLTLGQGANVVLSVPVFATASPPDQTLLEDTALTLVQFGEASGLDTPLTHVLSATTSTSGVTLTNGLPTGLSFDAATRRLTGTPTTPGVYTLTYTATDSDGDTATQTLKLTVVADTAPSFGASTVARQDYKQFAATGGLTLPAATGGNGTPVYSLSATTSDGTVDSADTLPEGLDFDADTRALSGTPTAAGTYAMTYSATDDDGDSVSLPFQLVVDSVPTLAKAVIGNQAHVKDYAITAVVLPQAEGGTGTVSYSLTGTTTDGTLASNLPAGLVFTASTRTLSGTPTAAGTYAMTYTATDSDSDSDARTFELTVAAFVPVCDRTAQIRDALVARLKSEGELGASDGCAQVTDRMLSGLNGTLSVSNPSPKLTALVASDFSGLSNLEVLDLSENSLTASGLPANVFSSLGSLTELNLADNALSANLSANLLAGLVALQELSLEGNSLTASHFPSTLFANTGLLTLNLSGNSLSGGLPSALPATLTGLELRDSGLTGLPAGFFTKFSSLTTLDLTDNTVALTLQLHYLGNSKIQARLREGAPWPLTVSVSGASGSGTQVSPGSISLTQGQTASAELQVSGYPATISLGSLPSVPATHSPTGLTLVRGGSLTLTVPTFSTSVADSRHTVGASSLSVQLPVATSGTDSITYSLSVSTDDGTLSNNLPAGLSFSSTTRTLSGVPTAAGSYAVTWAATDADADSVELTFNLVVEVDSTPAFAQSASIG